MNLIQVDNLTKTYQKGSVEIRALKDVSLDVKAGELVSIVGRSGSGKSTLLNLLGGLDTPTSGAIKFRDEDLASANRKKLAMHRRNTVGMIFQSFNLIPSRTATENLTLALAFGLTPRRERKKRAQELLNRVGLAERMDHKPGELSGGESQRVAIARALANRPEVMLADEPTGNLDSGTSEEIINLLLDFNREGQTLILVTHDEVLAKRVSNRVIRLLDGRVVEGSAA
jgi:putative ABC transport system ATP-binding protein